MIINKNWEKVKIIIIIFAIIEAFLTLAFIFFVGQFIQVATEGAQLKLIIWVIVMIFTFLVNILTNWLYKYILAKLMPTYHHQTRMLLLGKWFQIITKKLFSKGSINNALQNDMNTIISTHTNAIFSLTYGITTLLLIAGLLFWIHYILALVGLLSIFIIFILPFISQQKLQKLNIEASKNYQSFYALSETENKNKKQYLYIRRLADYHTNMIEALDAYGHKSAKITFLRSMIWQALYFLSWAIYIVPTIVGAILYGQGNINIGAIAILVLLSGEIIGIGDYLSNGFNSLFATKKLEAKYQLHNVQEIESLIFNKVIPIHDENKLTKNPVSFVMNSRKKLLLKGENGTGKSSILNILDSAISYRGQINFNQQNLNINNTYICRPIKTSAMFHSIQDLENHINTKDNFLYLKLKKAIQKTQVLKLSKNVSQGQLQLLSFLHAIANKPHILILDETLSSVSNTIRKSIYDILLAQKTMGMIVVDHTLASTREEKFDEVIIFN